MQHIRARRHGQLLQSESQTARYQIRPRRRLEPAGDDTEKTLLCEAVVKASERPHRREFGEHTLTLSMGIYLNTQHPETDDARVRYLELVEQTRTAQRLGFDSIWAGEHHLTPGFHFFPQLTLLANLAAYSGDMALGTNLVLLPLHNPVDLAERIALIDIACAGRFILTVGQGYRPEEFAAYGVPFEDRLPRMLQNIAAMRTLWSQRSVTLDGGWFSVKDATVRPGPMTPGGPPIWIGATSNRAIKRAGTIGDAFMATPNADNIEVQLQVRMFDQARRDAGIAPATSVGRMLEVYCHEDRTEARRRAGPALLTKYAAYTSWGLTGSAGAAAASAAEATDEQAFAELARDRFVIGNPDDVVAGLIHQYREVGITHLAMRIAWPGSSANDAMACIELLGREVLPRVRAALS
jgi:alkanesulfonate monooxygenase SsuD/methylene tetrahydromethanopterin reductase-like flavin-dependent oxidoreductase (luciferase family)